MEPLALTVSHNEAVVEFLSLTGITLKYADGRVAYRYPAVQSGYAAALSDCGRYLAISAPGEYAGMFGVIRVTDGVQLWRRVGRVESLYVDSEELICVVASRDCLERYSVETGQPIASLNLKEVQQGLSLTFSEHCVRGELKGATLLQFGAANAALLSRDLGVAWVRDDWWRDCILRFTHRGDMVVRTSAAGARTRVEAVVDGEIAYCWEGGAAKVAVIDRDWLLEIGSHAGVPTARCVCWSGKAARPCADIGPLMMSDFQAVVRGGVAYCRRVDFGPKTYYMDLYPPALCAAHEVALVAAAVAAIDDLDAATPSGALPLVRAVLVGFMAEDARLTQLRNACTTSASP